VYSCGGSSVVSHGFLSEFFEGNARTATKPANKNTHSTTQTIFLLAKSHDLIGTFLGTAFELSANCGLLSSSESKI
jgi:hypothetical protein